MKRVLVLGSGALQIGQAGEFDYSGSQALKVLREEGIASVLINPNIATIQTDQGLADKVYFLPVEPQFVEEVLKLENCDAVLLSFGGQSALNCGLALEEAGVFARLGVRVLGTPVSTIRDTEDRARFVERLREINVDTARSMAVSSVEDAVRAAGIIGYPVMLRCGFSLGGKGSSIVRTEQECRDVASSALSGAPQILVEECLSGWKEIEYEVVRDAADNCITVCNMENVDPMGIHTGESIVVAPSQTLDDTEYQLLRDVAIKTIRHLGIIGECNIQYALDPHSRAYRVIEVNARLSRSSALASKATGYPLAYVAAKIALGYDLPDIPNNITQVTTAFFEPALDYIVCKIPRWDIGKFLHADDKIGSEMKSVGEVMAIGRSFPEALQKALRMLDIGAAGLESHRYNFSDIDDELRRPTPKRIFAVAQALHKGYTVEHIHALSRIDPFFLYEIASVVALEHTLEDSGLKLDTLSSELMRTLKRKGFSDKQIGHKLHSHVDAVREKRKALGVRPYLKQIDTLAAEFPAKTNFLYSTYHADADDIQAPTRPSVLVLGSGCYRIGSSVEFDWCAVTAVQTARKLGYETLVINCNPETVSTDYDVCDRLIFEELTLERVLDVIEQQKPSGVIVSMGGQTPNNIAIQLANAGVPILGTSAESIDMAEDRHKFSALLDELGIGQPKWKEATGINDIGKTVASLGGFPVLIRPSYVLSGAAMGVAYTKSEAEAFLKQASTLSQEHPVVLSKFEENAQEIELDAVGSGGQLVAWVVSEHVEQAGVHSGDATLMVPPQSLSVAQIMRIREIAEKLARRLKIEGPFNIQLLLRDDVIKVIELNLRASRSFPFLSKATGVNLAQEATRVLLGVKSTQDYVANWMHLPYVVVKAPQFSFGRIKGADPRLGVEMASTGEVACFGKSCEEALLKAYMATGFKRPRNGIFVSVENGDAKLLYRDIATFFGMGFGIFSAGQTATELRQAGFSVTEIASANQLRELFQAKSIDWVISVPHGTLSTPNRLGYHCRRLAADFGVSLTLNIHTAQRLAKALVLVPNSAITIAPWSHYLPAPILDERAELTV